MGRIASFLVILLMVGTVNAAADDWVVLGTRTVDVLLDHDVIPVTIAEGVFNAIKLTVQDRGIEVLDLKVHYGNGNVHDAAVRDFIEAGGETRTIDLPGDVRVISKVEVWYRTRSRIPGKAVVNLLGRHPDAAALSDAPPTWEFLGERVVSLRVDRDVIPVTPTEGTFRGLKLKVLNGSVEVFDLKVVYGNGSVHDVAVRQVIPAGGETRAIDLPGAARVIKRIELVYRIRTRRPWRATVQAWGHR